MNAPYHTRAGAYSFQAGTNRLGIGGLFSRPDSRTNMTLNQFSIVAHKLILSVDHRFSHLTIQSPLLPTWYIAQDKSSLMTFHDS